MKLKNWFFKWKKFFNTLSLSCIRWIDCIRLPRPLNNFIERTSSFRIEIRSNLPNRNACDQTGCAWQWVIAFANIPESILLGLPKNSPVSHLVKLLKLELLLEKISLKLINKNIPFRFFRSKKQLINDLPQDLSLALFERLLDNVYRCLERLKGWRSTHI